MCILCAPLQGLNCLFNHPFIVGGLRIRNIVLGTWRRKTRCRWQPAGTHNFDGSPPAFLEAFEFDTPVAGRSLQAAVELLRELNRSGRRKLPDIVPGSGDHR